MTIAGDRVYNVTIVLRKDTYMSIKVVLFDLDGTLLPMDQELFTKCYFKYLSANLSKFGYEPQKLIAAVWSGTMSMIKNDGQHTNEEVFWAAFAKIFGDKVYADKAPFDKFYIDDFDKIIESCGYNEKAAETIATVKEKGLRIALATNPIFPAIATRKRIAWAGLGVEDFELYTTYENSSYCKPNPDYYKEIVKQLGVKPEECLMVGNDVSDDMVTEALGMKTFLLTDCLINKDNVDINRYNNGDFNDLINYIKNL